MTLFAPKIKKEDIAVFLENLSFLLGCGYTAFDAVTWVCEGTKVKRDAEAKRIQYIGNTLLTDLREGYALSTAMLHNPQFFDDYAKQVEAAEESDQVAEVLDQIVTNIREAGDLKHKIKSAMMYPAMVLTITVVVTWYLFTNVIPGILDTLASVGGGDIPPLTQMVMDITAWMQIYSVPTILMLIAIILILVILAKGPMKMQFCRLYTRLPLISKITLASNVTSWMQSMRYMLYAGSPMAHAMSTAAESMTNIYLKKQASEAYYLFATSGIPVPEALKSCSFLSAMEISTINVGLESGQVTEILYRLGKKRKEETDKAIHAFTTALNPVIICILGAVVGVIMLSVYGPLINITGSITG